ncbi:MAG: hypothetical protein BJ554DRAFT_6872, partial [Olpidium bornovanus]
KGPFSAATGPGRGEGAERQPPHIPPPARPPAAAMRNPFNALLVPKARKVVFETTVMVHELANVPHLSGMYYAKWKVPGFAGNASGGATGSRGREEGGQRTTARVVDAQSDVVALRRGTAAAFAVASAATAAGGVFVAELGPGGGRFDSDGAGTPRGRTAFSGAVEAPPGSEQFGTSMNVPDVGGENFAGNSLTFFAIRRNSKTSPPPPPQLPPPPFRQIPPPPSGSYERFFFYQEATPPFSWYSTGVVWGKGGNFFFN